MFNASGSLTVLNSTFALNGRQPDGVLDIYSTTHPDLSSPPADSLAMNNSILASTGGVNVIAVSQSTGSNNFILVNGVTIGPLTLFPFQGTFSTANPELSTAGLANNGGPTDTIALQSNSPAIGGGGSAGAPATDQRGVPRPQTVGTSTRVDAGGVSGADGQFLGRSDEHFRDRRRGHADGRRLSGPALPCYRHADLRRHGRVRVGLHRVGHVGHDPRWIDDRHRDDHPHRQNSTSNSNASPGNTITVTSATATEGAEAIIASPPLSVTITPVNLKVSLALTSTSFSEASGTSTLTATLDPGQTPVDEPIIITIGFTRPRPTAR